MNLWHDYITTGPLVKYFVKKIITRQQKNLPCLQGRGTALKGGGGVVPTTEPFRFRTSSTFFA